MIAELAQSEGKYIGFKLSGKIDSNTEQQWLGKLDRLIAEHNKIRILLLLDDDAGWGVEAGWQDIKWVFHNIRHIEKVAVVSDSRVWEWLIKVDAVLAKLVNIDESHFHHDQLYQAWQWLKAD
ncbi:STAS/SEC14 domain-containing protein [Thalassotalea mangrovi]|uniref:STAS/SEC14 domain-containing protein n=1 Tax=Thalassotalea mangrovi TaxID=2572245 RepID=A0A4U1B8L7_9GAMM|nr:STAS/SEC14 domain-containing protein [Thalassotalea mangrovi]TKB46355.1 STAS/SEC14 domain-containing protein [Thalassotalea mangrovi]